MKKFTNKKGFTIVELVIVIAVIAILAAVLIPTFSGVIDNANKSAANQQANNALKVVTMKLAEDNIDLGSKGLYFVVKQGSKYYGYTYSATSPLTPDTSNPFDAETSTEEGVTAPTLTDYNYKATKTQFADLPDDVTVYGTTEVKTALSGAEVE